MGIYAADGSWNVTIVDGTTFTSYYAADGSVNVVHDTVFFGAYHPCGALRVTYTSSAVNQRYAPDGSIYVSTTPYVTGAQPVTAVSGSFGPPPSGAFYVWIFS